MANKIFRRPQKLSDPFRDFSQEELQQIINTKDNQMGFHELNCLFNSFLPAGTYDEVVYFFPIALDYVFKKKEEWFTLFDNLLTWVMVHRECLEKDELLQYSVPLSEIWDDALKIIPDEEIALEIITNAVNRLKIRIIDWDKDKCEKCQLCIPDCPTKCISFDEREDTIVRDKDRCLRCSICYQTCPFSVIKYFIAKFSFDGGENINVTVKASNLNEDIVME
jgi:Pyruvate/2-oxoacid:ferredoxin oxidoreductase delta subunit